MKSLKKNNYNKLCMKCIRKCKQSDTAILVNCPKFKPMPRQLELNFNKRIRKKKSGKKDENYSGKIQKNSSLHS